MADRLTVPTLGFLALAGLGSGILLGRSAISEIDPAYFSDPGPRFHADLAPHRSASAPPALVRPEEVLALGPGCVGCGSAVEVYPVYEASAGRYRSGYAESSAVAEPVYTEPTPEELQHRAELARIEQYASYRVSEDEPATFVEAAAPDDQREEPAVD